MWIQNSKYIKYYRRKAEGLWEWFCRFFFVKHNCCVKVERKHLQTHTLWCLFLIVVLAHEVSEGRTAVCRELCVFLVTWLILRGLLSLTRDNIKTFIRHKNIWAVHQPRTLRKNKMFQNICNIFCSLNTSRVFFGGSRICW